MSLGWNCHSWQNSETPGSVSMVTWYSAVRMWKPWSRSPSTRRLPTWHCPGGTQRRRAPYLLTSAPQSPAACCCSATAACGEFSPTGSPGPISSPSSYWTVFSTLSWTWAQAASRWKPAARGWMTASGATWTSRGEGATVRELCLFVTARGKPPVCFRLLCSSSCSCGGERRVLSCEITLCQHRYSHISTAAYSLQRNMHAYSGLITGIFLVVIIYVWHFEICVHLLHKRPIIQPDTSNWTLLVQSKCLPKKNTPSSFPSSYFTFP